MNTATKRPVLYITKIANQPFLELELQKVTEGVIQADLRFLLADVGIGMPEVFPPATRVIGAMHGDLRVGVDMVIEAGVSFDFKTGKFSALLIDADITALVVQIPATKEHIRILEDYLDHDNQPT